VRMAFLAIQCLEASMPYGGRIEVSCDAGAWAARGQAPNINPDAALWAVLEGADNSALAPAHVQFALLAAVAQDADRPLASQIDNDQMCITF
jgi:histidine phosphotransferase ChpT